MNETTPQQTKNNERWKSFLLLALAVCVIFFLRTFNTTYIEVYDALKKWIYANMLNNGYYQIPKNTDSTHHYLRWAINVPTAFAIWLFGFSLRLYFAIPILTFSVFLVLFLKRVAKDMALPLVILLGILIYTDPMMVRMSTQLHTRIFGSFYLLLCFLALEMKNQRTGIILCALSLFMAYGSKETYGLFFGPVLGLYILCKRPWRNTLTFGSILLILLGIETLFINAAVNGNITGGRFQVILEGNHLKYTIYSFKDLNFYKMLVHPWRHYSLLFGYMAMIALGYGILSLVIPQLRRRLSQFEFLTHASIVFYFFCMIFGIVSLHPFVPIQPPIAIYYAPLFPFIYYSLLLLVKQLAMLAAHYFPLNKIQRHMHITALTVASILMAMFIMQKPVFPFYNTPENVLYHVPYGMSYWTADKKLIRVREHLKQGYTLVKLPRDSGYKILGLVYNLRQSGTEIRDRRKFWWNKYQGKEFFSATYLTHDQRKNCIYLPYTKLWALFLPDEEEYRPCGFNIPPADTPKNQRNGNKKQ